MERTDQSMGQLINIQYIRERSMLVNCFLVHEQTLIKFKKSVNYSRNHVEYVKGIEENLE